MTAALTANIDRISYGRCRSGSTVELVKLKNSGHGTPGYAVAPSLVGLINPSNTEVNGYQLAWDFLSRFKR